MFYCSSPTQTRVNLHRGGKKTLAVKKSRKAQKSEETLQKKPKVFMGNSMKKAEAQVVVEGFRLGGKSPCETRARWVRAPSLGWGH